MSERLRHESHNTHNTPLVPAAEISVPESQLPELSRMYEEPEGILARLESLNLPKLAKAAETRAGDIAIEALEGNPIYPDDKSNLLVAGYLTDLSERQTVEFESLDPDFRGIKGGVRDIHTRSHGGKLNVLLARQWVNLGRTLKGGAEKPDVSEDIAIQCALARIEKISFPKTATDALAELVSTVGYDKAVSGIKASAKE